MFYNNIPDCAVLPHRQGEIKVKTALKYCLKYFSKFYTISNNFFSASLRAAMSFNSVKLILKNKLNFSKSNLILLSIFLINDEMLCVLSTIIQFVFIVHDEAWDFYVSMQHMASSSINTHGIIH